MRARYLAIQQMAEVFAKVDIIVAPTTGPSKQVNATNLTGHPAVIVPNGLRGPDAPPSMSFGGLGGAGAATTSPAAAAASANNQSGGTNTPVSLTFVGGLYKDAQLCAFAHAYQQAAGFLDLHPTLA